MEGKAIKLICPWSQKPHDINYLHNELGYPLENISWSTGKAESKCNRYISIVQSLCIGKNNIGWGKRVSCSTFKN